MSEPSHSEVLNFLKSESFFVEDLPEWQTVVASNSTITAKLTFGLLDSSMSRTKFFVELMIQTSSITQKRILKFSLFKGEFKSTIRYYQLEVKKFKKLSQIDKHGMPHEHIGKSPEGRIIGSINWLKWNFDDALKHFLSRVSITFLNETPSDPENFYLKA